MAREDLENSMKPRRGSREVYLPVTFDYSGGRSEKKKGKWILAVAVAILSLIFGIGTIISTNGNIIINIIFGVLIISIGSILIRFAILGEAKVRNSEAELINSNYQFDFKSFWGIYDIDDEYPYYCRLRNGRSVIFVEFAKDTVLGKVSDSEYEHYEAIGEAYKIAGSSNIGMCHIDYMDNVGTDERLTDCFDRLPNIKNSDIRTVLTGVFTNLQSMMSEKVTTFDVYAFSFNTSESIFWYNIQKIISCMMDANYISFKILDSDGIRNLTKSIFNIQDFSIIDATSNTFSDSSYRGVRPIKLIKYDGSEVVLNKTLKELEEERKEAEENKSKGKNKKNKKKQKQKDEEINLFD